VPPILIVAATDRELCGHDGLVCGVGPVEAAASTARALALRPFAAVLHVGLAGGRGIAPGSLVVGTEAVYCDLAAEWPVIERALGDDRLVSTAQAALPGSVAVPIHTSAAVGGTRDAVSEGPLVEAMEGFGVLRAAALAGVPAVEVRAVSNALGEPDRERWGIPEALTVLEGAIPAVLAALERAVPAS
jgi:futalosine hydrolase